MNSDFAALVKAACEDCLAVLGHDGLGRPRIRSRTESRAIQNHGGLGSEVDLADQAKFSERPPSISFVAWETPDATISLYHSWDRFANLPNVIQLREGIRPILPQVLPAQVASVPRDRTEVRPGMLLIDDWMTIPSIAQGLESLWSGGSLLAYAEQYARDVTKASERPRRFICQALLEGFDSPAETLIRLDGVWIRRMTRAEWSEVFTPRPDGRSPDGMWDTHWVLEVELETGDDPMALKENPAALFETLLAALRLFKSGDLAIRHVRQRRDFWPRRGWQGQTSRHMEEGVCWRGYELAGDDIADFEQFWKEHSTLLRSEDTTLHNAVMRFNDSFRRHSKEDAVLDRVIALECVLKGSAASRFSQRGAMLLGENPAQRRAIHALLLEAYQQRNGFVHDGSRRAPNPINDDLERLLRRCLQVYLRLAKVRRVPWGKILEALDLWVIERDEGEAFDPYLLRRGLAG